MCVKTTVSPTLLAWVRAWVFLFYSAVLTHLFFPLQIVEYVCHNYCIPHFVGLGVGLDVSVLLCHFNSLVFPSLDSGVRVSQLRHPPLCWPGCGPGGQRSRPSFHTQVNKFRCLLWIKPQSKQSAKLFLQSSEL